MQNAVQVQIIRTEVVDHQNYVDLAVINGIVKSQHYRKVGEPNHFKLVSETTGDNVHAMVRSLKNNSK